jgi:hypothetical protein
VAGNVVDGIVRLWFVIRGEDVMYFIKPFLAISDIGGGGEWVSNGEHGLNEVIRSITSVVDFGSCVLVDKVKGDSWGEGVEEGDDVVGWGVSILELDVEEVDQGGMVEGYGV